MIIGLDNKELSLFSTVWTISSQSVILIMYNSVIESKNYTK